MTELRLVATMLMLAACGGTESRKTAPVAPDQATECRPREPGDDTTPLRGTLKEPDPRRPATLTSKGFALDAPGLSRALAADDPTAHLAALTAISILACRQLMPRVEALLAAPAPTAVEAAATLAELGTTAQRTRALDRLHEALADASWPEVQVTAAAYLARARDPASVPAIRAALRSTNEAVRLQAVISLGAFASFDEATFSRLAELTVVLGDPASSWLVRREAVYQVARLPTSPERQALLDRVAANDADERVRRAAALRATP